LGETADARWRPAAKQAAGLKGIQTKFKMNRGRNLKVTGEMVRQENGKAADGRTQGAKEKGAEKKPKKNSAKDARTANNSRPLNQGVRARSGDGEELRSRKRGRSSRPAGCEKNWEKCTGSSQKTLVLKEKLVRRVPTRPPEQNGKCLLSDGKTSRS